MQLQYMATLLINLRSTWMIICISITKRHMQNIKHRFKKAAKSFIKHET